VEVDTVHQEAVLEKVGDTTSSWTQTLDLHNMTTDILQEGKTCDMDLQREALMTSMLGPETGKAQEEVGPEDLQ